MNTVAPSLLEKVAIGNISTIKDIPRVFKLREAKTAELQTEAAAIALSVFFIALGVGCAYDAYKNTKSIARAIGGFLFPVPYLTLIREWK
jgi:hypothetical protein